MFKMPNCKHCKGEGNVYPVVTTECTFCFNHPEGKKKCCECMGSGWTKRTVSELCEICGGTGKKN